MLEANKLKVKIINIDKDAKRISLSYKETLDNPWTKVMNSVGQKVKIKIKNITDKAIFGELDSGLVGMLHYKEINFEEKGEKDANAIIENKFKLIQDVNYNKFRKYSLTIKTSKIKKQVLNLFKMRGLIMPSGKVKWFNAKKGYGFIKDDETQKDIFLHVSALENSKLRVLKEEQTIFYDIKEEKDKLQAINIKKK